LSAGDPLAEAHRATRWAQEAAISTKIDFMVDNALLFERFIAALTGDTEQSGLLSSDDAHGAFEKRVQQGIPMLQFLYHVYRTIAGYIVRDFAVARAAATAAEALRWAGLYGMPEVERRFYSALTTAAVWDGAGEGERADMKRQLAEHEASFRAWSESC